MSLTLTSIPATRPVAEAPTPPSAEPLLHASLEPAKDAARYVYKITEQSTGRVILELPFPPSATPAPSAEDVPAQKVNVTV